jgi:hypothetical protein
VEDNMKLRKRLGGILSAALAAVLLSGPADSAILGLNSNGGVYTIDVTNATATLFTNVGALSGNFQPNSIARAGSDLYFTDFGSAPSNFYKNSTGNVVTSDLPGGNIASGDIAGGRYYYMTQSTLRSVDLNGAGATEQSISGLGTNPNYGDIAIRNGVVYASHSENRFSTFSLGGPFNATNVAAIRMYAGLAFSGDQLFGLTATGSLYSLTLGGVGTLIGNVTVGGTALTNWTDSTSVIPLPPAALLLFGALGGLGFVARRRRKATA